jgi:heme exporter protein B
VLVQRAFAIEADDGALDALRVAGVDPVAVYWGKAMALAAQVAVLEVLLLVAAVLLYGADIPAGGLVLLAVTLVPRDGWSGMRRYAVRRPHRRVHGSRDVAPAARTPVVAPVLIGATRAVESALGTDGAALPDGWPWVTCSPCSPSPSVSGVPWRSALIDEAT